MLISFIREEIARRAMIDVSFPLKTSIVASGDSALGRGVHGAIPLHLVFEAQNLDVKGSLKYKIALTPK